MSFRDKCFERYHVEKEYLRPYLEKEYVKDVLEITSWRPCLGDHCLMSFFEMISLINVLNAPFPQIPTCDAFAN